MICENISLSWLLVARWIKERWSVISSGLLVILMVSVVKTLKLSPGDFSRVEEL